MPEDVVELPVDIEPQPDGITCGPTCLHALYRYHGLDVSLSKVIGSVTSLDEGGTLEVHLACDALKRGFEATIYTFNLNLFDPTWFEDADTDIAAKLRERAARKRSAKFKFAVEGYCEFLERGGRLRFTDLTRGELRGMFRRGVPVIAGLNLTYLYRQARIAGPHDDPDDVHGESCGHFVVLAGYNREDRSIAVADPYVPNPVGAGHKYWVHIDRVIGAILLGVMTYDASLLILEREK
ncbi:MAG: hypothetical protein IPM80_19565 [Proteobacteria bacterium]|nr:hypothetical protein [Pseudomonadota bacterium]MBK8960549.1 hypothetical protein [Pseudomonadota bacterium]